MIYFHCLDKITVKIYKKIKGGNKLEGKNWFNKEIKDVEKELETNQETGLSAEEVVKRRETYGLNQLKEKKKKSLFMRFVDQFKDFSIIILIIAAIVSGFVGVAEGEGITDTIIILIVVILNAVIGVTQESKAEKSLEALQKLTDHASKVIRDGNVTVVPAKELVPGDIVVLDTGDYIPADLRIIEAVNLKTQESSLTGESVPVDKTTEKIDGEDVGIGDRTNMLFSSSLVTYGRGKGIVVETGMTTEVGKIAEMINETEEQITPLQQKLNKLGKTLGITAIVICVVIFIIGLFQQKEPIHMFMTAVSLAVAAIPEGLVAVSTIVLAIGVQKMVKRNAIVKKLPAVETLGSATVICSDKTGTLTQNKMTVEKVFLNGEIKDLEEIDSKHVSEDMTTLVYANMLCNDTKIAKDGTLTGDPTETALVDMAFTLNFDPSIYDRMTRIAEVPFDSDRKLMTTVNKVNQSYIAYTKGGVDELLKICKGYLYNHEIKNDLDNYAVTIRQKNEEMAKEAGYDDVWEYMKSPNNPKMTQYLRTSSDSCVADGAAACIVVPTEMAGQFTDKPIEVLGIGASVLDAIVPHLEKKATAEAARQVYELTGLTADDMDLLLVNDFIGSSAFLAAEEVGYLPKGEGWKYVLDGRIAYDGDKPMNTNGGRTSYGHAFAASGMADVFEAVTQMRGEAGERQVKKLPKHTFLRGFGGAQNVRAIILESKF